MKRSKNWECDANIKRYRKINSKIISYNILIAFNILIN